MALPTAGLYLSFMPIGLEAQKVCAIARNGELFARFCHSPASGVWIVVGGVWIGDGRCYEMS